MADKDKKEIPEQPDIFGASENTSPEKTDSGNNEESTVEKESGSSESDVKTGSESFEKLLLRLEEITEKMESGGLSLDESMKLYEEGVKHAEILTAQLKEVRNRVMKLVSNSSGDATLEDFDEE